MGRAGAGGYATVQHAYDTRLKRDVAIKCIQITQADIDRSRVSIHDAQIENASRALRGDRAGRRDAGYRRDVQPQDDGSSAGFVPLTSKISEPSFFSSREKNAERLAKRRSYFKEAKASVGNSAVRGRGRLSDTEDFDDDSQGFDDQPLDLSEFEGYSSFKGPRNAGSQRRRDMDSLPIGKNDTVGLREFAGHIPGRIAGAGEADISAIGEHSISIAGVEGAPGSRRGRAGGDAARRFGRKGAARRDDPAFDPAVDSYDVYDPSDSFEPVPYEGDRLARVDRIPGLEEARTAAHLNDANIVTVYDCVVEGNMAYVIMEYVEGKTLAKIMRELGNDITLDMIASVFGSVSHALEVAHKAGILHLDIKPENVIVNKEGVVKVTDFGLSTLMDASGQGETGGGTIGYMPLEQMRQQRLDVRTDEWALASLTYEMLSGKNPFKARNLDDAELAIEGAELVIPSLCWEEIDESVDDIMFDALSPDMEGRYPDIEAFSEDLMPLLGSAREGKAQLAQAVKDSESLREEKEPRPQKPYVPFIDRLGMRGSNILMRAFAALGAAMLGVIALMNFRFDFAQASQQAASQTIEAGSNTVFGLFSTVPIAAWAILVVLVALAVLWPRFAMPAGYVLLVVAFFFNQAWLPAFLLLAGTGAWWWFFGRRSDMMATLVMLQPLFGSIGFAALVPVLAGALLDVKDALLTTGMAVLGAFVLASMGSGDVMNWEIVPNIIVAVNPSIAGASMSSGFIESLSSVQNWAVVAGWLAAAALYSLLCRRGTHAFDIMASVAAAVCIVVGVLVVPIATNDMGLLTPLAVSGAVVPALVGIVFALLDVPDRVRMAPGEW